jgi:acetyl-CoA carboxylase biotin carboxyl carrier protein
MDMRKIRKLIELIQSTGVAEIEIGEGEESVRITRETRVTSSQQPIMMMAPPQAAAAPLAPPAAPAPEQNRRRLKHLINIL